MAALPHHAMDAAKSVYEEARVDDGWVLEEQAAARPPALIVAVAPVAPPRDAREVDDGWSLAAIADQPRPLPPPPLPPLPPAPAYKPPIPSLVSLPPRPKTPLPVPVIASELALPLPAPPVVAVVAFEAAETAFFDAGEALPPVLDDAPRGKLRAGWRKLVSYFR